MNGSAISRWLLTATACSLVVGPGSARADDGSYGRLEGDAMVEIEAGGSYAAGSEAVRGLALTGRVALFYLQTVGLTFQYADRLGQPDAPIARTVAGAVELRPLFLGRFTQNLEQGPAHLDLILDSLGLSLGIWHAWREQPRCGADCFAHGMDAGIGLQIPFLPRINSPYVAFRGAVRWRLDDLSANLERSPPSGLFTITLGYHHVFTMHLVDAGERLEE